MEKSNSLQDINGIDIYDKAKWQLESDTPIQEKKVFRHFEIIFEFLKEKNLLTEEGIEDSEDARSEDDVFWNAQIKPEAHSFFHKYYDSLLNSAEYGSEEFRTNLIEWYSVYEKDIKK